MASMALYRAWRPSRFSDMVGQEVMVTTLKNQIASGRTSHAYLFSGSRGTGKTTAAKIFARAVNCMTPDDGDPCGVCEACVALSAENNMDIVEIDAASNNGVDEIRDLRDKIKYPPQHGRYRVYIIDEVHMLSTGAFNALLKTLEEPPSHAMFILATTEPQKLPATVLSRCQRFDFKRYPAHVIVGRLEMVLKGEGAEATQGALSVIARVAEGGMRDALGLLDMCIAFGGGSVDESLVRDMLGAVSGEMIFQFADAIIRGDASGALARIDELMRAGREAQVFIRDVTAHLRALLLAQSCQREALPDLLEITEEEAGRIFAQSAESSRERLLLLLDLFMAADSDMRWSSQPRIALEMTAARACLPEESMRAEALAARVELLEKRIEELLKRPAIAAEPAKTAPPAREAAKKPQTDAARPAPAPSGDAKAIFDAAMKLLLKEPGLHSQLRLGKFAGIEDGVATVLFAKEQAIHRDLLSAAGRKERIEQVFAEAAGGPITLVLALETEKKEKTKGQQDALAAVIDMFGRENVQVVDHQEKGE